MLISTSPQRRLAAAFAVSVLFSFPCAPAHGQRPALPEGMLDAGSHSDHDFSLEARTLVRNGDLVRFRLVAIGRYSKDIYDSRVEVDCAHRTRRELSGLSIDEHGAMHQFEGESVFHDVAPNTRMDLELRVACNRAAVALGPPVVAASPIPSATVAQAQGRVSAIAMAADIVEVGTDGRSSYAILVDSVIHRDSHTGYDVQDTAPDRAWATRRHYVVDCEHKLRAFQPDDIASGVRLTAAHVGANSREAHELATACAMPDGPRTRWFAGFVVTHDGVVVAPHRRTAGCTRFSTGSGAQRRSLQLIAQEEDVTLLRMPGGGPWPVMPGFDAPPSSARLPVTMMGVAGTVPRVSAAFATASGSNPDDPGWPQVLTLSSQALNEGLVWNSAGAAIGVAVARQGGDMTHAFVRMLPTSEVRLRMARHGLTWPASDASALDAEAAMRLALAATVPLICDR